MPARPLCLLSVARSGSTLLQRLLNLPPEVILFGEHGGFLTGLATAWAALDAPEARQNLAAGLAGGAALLAGQPPPANEYGFSVEWANLLEPAAPAAGFRELLGELLYPPAARRAEHRWWGFKEIRYGVAEIAFLAALFPEMRFVLLLRDPLAGAHSFYRTGWDAMRDPEAAAAAARRHANQARLLDAWEMLAQPEWSGRARLVCYEQLVARPEAHLRALTEWLEVAMPAAAAVAGVMASGTGPARQPITAGQQERLARYLAGLGRLDQARHAALLRHAMVPG